MESKIESALQPGHFIGWDHEASFVSVLRDAEHDNAALAGDDPMPFADWAFWRLAAVGTTV